MIVDCEDSTWKSTNFDIVTWNGMVTCFAWQNEKLVVFPYCANQTSTALLSTISVPKPIKCIHSFDGRVFIVCKPRGIYKMRPNDKVIARLGLNAVGVGFKMYQILAVNGDKLYLIDRSVEPVVTTQVLNCPGWEPNTENFHVLVLNPNEIDESFKNALSIDTNPSCFITMNQKLYQLSENWIKLIYTSFFDITDIMCVRKNEKIAGVLLKTNCESLVVGYLHEGKLIFKRTRLNSKPVTAAAQFTGDGVIQIVYADEANVISVQKDVKSDAFVTVGSKQAKILQLVCYKNTFLGLSTDNQLIEHSFPRNDSANQDSGLNKFQEPMCSGTDVIMEKISEKTKELQIASEKCLLLQDQLNRITIYGLKKKIVNFPKLRVNKIGKTVGITATFDNSVPKNTTIYLKAKCDFRTYFSSKLIEDSETIVQLELNPELLDSSLEITMDLVTFAEENKPWCIIRNCLKQPSRQECNQVRELLNEKKAFFNTQLNVLRNLKQEDKLDMNKLTIIKKRVRKELPNL